MLLRRLMGHFTRQNWLAVVLDLAIVILGVFIGFQVTAWNEARQDRAAEFAALVRLQGEAEQVVAYWRMEVRQQEKFNDNRKMLLEVLDNGEITPEQEPAVNDAIMRLGHYPQFNPPRSVYDELIASGGLGRISNIEVRNAVAAYAAELDFAMGQLTQFRTTLPRLYRASDGRILSKYDPDKRSLRRYEYDIARLASDEHFVSVVVDAVRDQLQFLTIRKGVLRRAASMCEAVSSAVSTTCEVVEVKEEEIRARDGINQ